MMAISRELTYASVPLPLSKRLRWNSPTLGRVLLVSAELVLVMLLCFYMMNPYDQWQWEDIGYRTGYIALAQLPLIFLLAGKNNIVGFLIGSSYEKLNWLHRWTARILFLTVTIHMGFWFVGWARYDYILHKMKEDNITKRGFSAWCILLWIVLSSFAPIRRWNYEFFVIQHVVTFAGFIAAVYLHVPTEVKIWVWIPIGLVIFDRLARALLVLYANLSVFRPKRYREGFWACKATFEPLRSDMTRIVIRNPPISWSVGQHVLLSCHSIAPFQSHPFTIASIPQDGTMEFLIKSKSGGTKRFFEHAQKHQRLPLTQANTLASHRASVVIEGPYGAIRPLRQFDSLFLIAGSSGATFTVPLMRDVVASWKAADSQRSQGILGYPPGAVTRYIRFIWVIKSRDQLSWFFVQLETVAQDLEHLKRNGYDLEIDMSIYITCDENLRVDSKENIKLAPSGQPRAAPAEGPQKPNPATSINIEIEKAGNDHISVHSTPSHSQVEEDGETVDKPRKPCCCTVIVENEAEVSASGDCGCVDTQDTKGSIDSSNVSTKSLAALGLPMPAGQPVHSSIKTLSGRPQIISLLRRVAEQALGETAVGVCGPQGLVDDVRKSIVALSDERAVHKGSGAQGIYLHTEAFDY